MSIRVRFLDKEYYEISESSECPLDPYPVYQLVDSIGVEL